MHSWSGTVIRHLGKSSAVYVLFLITLNSVPGFSAPQGKGRQHRYGKNRQQMTDRNGDGIEDGFQYRYGQNRKRKIVNSHLPWIEDIMKLPETSQIRLVCRLAEIPQWDTFQNQKCFQNVLVGPPLIYDIEENQTLVIFYSWLSPDSAMHRWYLSLKNGKPTRLEGVLICSLPSQPDENAVPHKQKITWQEDK